MMNKNGVCSVAKILKKEKLNPFVSKMVVYAPLIAKKARAGQFVILRVSERGERIPLTIADHDKKNGTVTIIYQIVGKTTRLLDALEKNDEILNFVGPLGKPSELDGYGRVAVIGGGVGCAIAYPQAKELSSRGVKVDVIAGFRNKEIIILEDEMRSVARKLTITTDDGSNGNRGFVTDVLRNELSSGEVYDLVLAVGPIPMMKAVCDLTRTFSVKTVVSMNPVMIDGTGMCGGCRIKVGGKVKFACVDGPEFDGHEVDFDEAMRRVSMYKSQERDSDCNLLKGEKYAEHE